MDHFCLTVLCCLFLIAAISQYTESALSIVVSPEVLNAGLTTKLTVKCVYVKNDTSNPSALVSLFLSRATNGSSSYDELASINLFTGQQVNLMTQENVQASGVINSTGESFLDLTWDLPTEELTGSYKCTAQGPDHVGHNVVIDSTVNVTFSPPDNKDLLSQIQLLESHLKQVEQSINVMKTDFSGQVAQVSKNDSYLLALSEHTAQEIQALTQSNAQSSQAEIKLLYGALVSSFFTHEYQGPNATYWLSRSSFKNVKDAEDLCKSFRGRLVEINSDAEYAGVREFLNKLGAGINFIYVGATDEQAEDHWVYRSDGTPVEFTDWAINQPRPGVDYNCMFMEESLGWRMSAYRCASNQPIYALCELQ